MGRVARTAGCATIAAMRRWLVIAAVAAPLLAAGCSGDDGVPLGMAADDTVYEMARQGDAEAQFALGLKYETGSGVAVDAAEAVRWYRKAAEQGDPPAQAAMGDIHARGFGVPQDYPQAADWYRKAAAQGNTTAQFKLGNLYENGLGVPQDYQVAARWYTRAGANWRAEATSPPGTERIVGALPEAPVLIAPGSGGQETVAAVAPTPEPVPAAETEFASAPETEVAVAAPVSAAVSADDARGLWFHIASFQYWETAEAAWVILNERHADLLGPLEMSLAEIDLGADRGVWIRVRAGPFADAASAEALCDALRARDQYCKLWPR